MHKINKSILIICPYPLGHAPSQRFRFEQYLSQLSQVGFHWVAKPFYSVETWKILYEPGMYGRKFFGLVQGFFSRIGTLFSVASYDYVLIHREATPVGPPLFEFLTAHLFGRKIIYDFDDSIWLPNTSAENKLAAKLKWHSKVAAICRWSYRISGGNRYLCEFACQYNPRTTINPTTIDTDALHNPQRYAPSNTHKSLITIGWTGTHSTLKYLEALEPVLASLEMKFQNQIQFLVIANKPPRLNLKTLKFVPWTVEREVEDLLHMDIGIMPLTDDLWAKGKCGFKALQYMALQIPTLASPVGVNTEIIQHGENGLLCNSDEEWESNLTQLIENNQVRRSLGKAARETVVARYSVSSNTSNFLSLFE